MKKLAMVCLVGAVLAPAANADMIGIYAGAGYWQAGFTGIVGDNNGSNVSVEELNLDEVGSNYVWAHIEHPFPLIPNVRLMHTRIQTQAQSNATRDFNWLGVGFSVTSDVQTEMDISHTDATLYYELLDNWVSLDAGITARYLDGFVNVASEVSEPNRSELKGVVPMLYLNAEFEVPFANLTFGLNGNGIRHDGDGVVDLSATVGYFVELGPLLDLGAKLGYRRLQLNAQNLDELYADITAEGPFAELYIHF